ncbi:putative disease resistance RPP13-like protein 1 [Coffea eugenioides]|uniref:putative disease resistance RPP13-like protein 1 n=1 Tax=Coffea eugenioides TaxID=49369 RepID=UPI000F612730|nr:putative disease resistance RPP13-like protein 1 [Coffea eugenioides]
MGSSALGAFLQVVFDRMATKEFLNLFRGRENDGELLEKLKLNLQIVGDVLDDAENKQTSSLAVKGWLNKLHDTIYEADDLLDEINTEELRLKVEAKCNNSTSQVSALNYSSSFSNDFLGKMMPQIEKMVARLDWFIQQINPMGLQVVEPKMQSRRTPSTSLVDEARVYGRDADKEKIIKMLLCESANGVNFTVISVVGLGGIGKTTLAQLIYKDKRVQNHFPTKASVCISEDYDAARITKELLEGLDIPLSDARENLNSLQVKLQMGLNDKKFLVVLDDYWNRDYNEWDRFKVLFTGAMQGTKIIVTTRDEKIALMMCKKESIYSLDLIAEEDCWSLFEKHAFENKDGDHGPELEDIGKKIVKKCARLPLAVKTVAGLLRSKTTAEEWEDILVSEVWTQTDNEDDILPALRLSYSHLPSRLKRCFACCAVFHKDFEFRKEEIIHLWQANDLLEPPGENRGIEQIGEEYLRELRLRSLLEQSTDDCKTLAKLPVSLVKLINLSCLDISGTPLKKMPLYTGRLRNLRVLTNFIVGKDSGSMIEELGKLPKLRGRLIISKLENVSNGGDASTANLKGKEHLEELTLEWNGAVNDSQAVRNVLDNLQPHSSIKHLKIIGYDGTTFPDWLGNSSLSHLESLSLSNCEICFSLPALGQLQSLQSLEIVGMSYIFDLVENFYGDVSATKPFPSLKKLRIEKLPEWERWKYQKISGLKNLKELPLQLNQLSQLEELRVDDCRSLSPSHVSRPLASLKSLVCTGRCNLELESSSGEGGGALEYLTLGNCDSVKVKAEWLASFPMLKDVKIKCCKSVEMLSVAAAPAPAPAPRIGNQSGTTTTTTTTTSVMTSLQSLHVSHCDDLIIMSFPAPSLTWLIISNCKKLTSLPQRMESVLPSLRSLRLFNCPEIECFLEGGLPSTLQSLYIYDCKKLMSRRREWDLEKLPYLTRLTIMGRCDEVESFPEKDWLLPCMLQYLLLSSLQNLKVLNYSALRHLTSLQNRELSNCPRLQSLPDEGLPASLTQLHIWRCSLLKPRLE